VRIAGEPAATNFATELRHFVFTESAFEIGARVNAWRSVTLQVDVIANECSFTSAEEMVEANFVK
jgi:hypothetical protein